MSKAGKSVGQYLLCRVEQACRRRMFEGFYLHFSACLRCTHSQWQCERCVVVVVAVVVLLDECYLFQVDTASRRQMRDKQAFLSGTFLRTWRTGFNFAKSADARHRSSDQQVKLHTTICLHGMKNHRMCTLRMLVELGVFLRRI